MICEQHNVIGLQMNKFVTVAIKEEWLERKLFKKTSGYSRFVHDKDNWRKTIAWEYETNDSFIIFTAHFAKFGANKQLNLSKTGN